MTTTTLSGTNSHGIKLGAGNYGLTLTVTGSGHIQGTSYGVYAPTLSSNELLVNDGLITATLDGVFFNTPGTLINAGSIDGGDFGAGMFGYDPAYINAGRTDYFQNTGRISGGTYGAYFYHVTATNAGTITGDNIGVKLTGDVFVNSNSISGGTIGLAVLQGTVSNTVEGHISSQNIGMFASSPFNNPLVISNAGSIYGGKDGAFVYNGSITNAGTIGGGGTGLWLTAATGVNNGLIYGSDVGAYFGGTPFQIEGSFTNSSIGTINSANGIGLSAVDDGIVLNNGTINGKLAGAYIDGGSFTNDGVIISGSIGVAAYGGVLNDSGTVTGGKYAILATGDFTLMLTNTAVINGKVEDSAGTGVLELQGNGPGSLGGFGTNIAGFSSIAFAAGWTLEGNTKGLANGQVITGFTLGDTLVLDGFSENGTSLTAAGLILRNGNISETIDLATVPVISDLSISSGGGKSTISFVAPLAPISIISSFEPATLTPGDNNIATNLTITSAGYAAGIKTGLSDTGTVTNFGSINNVNFHNYSTLFNYGVIAGRGGVIAYSDDRLTNAGTIIGTGSNGVGVDLKDFFSTLTNAGEITSSGTAVYSFYFNSIVNTGLIAGDAFILGDHLNNSGEILGLSTFGIGGTSTYIDNTGTITGPGYGIAQRFGAVIKNTGTISGKKYGISVTGATIVDSGLISGGTYAIHSNSTDPNSGFFYTLSLELDPGARLTGAVADESREGTLFMGGSTSATFDMGSSFSGFSNINFEKGSTWQLEGAKDDLASGETISGFSMDETIILDHFSPNPTDTTYLSGIGLKLTDTGGNQVTVDIAGSFSTTDFIISDSQGNTVIDVVCYLRGTHIATSAGEVAVEALKIGDAVITRFSGYQKVKWIGRQSFSRLFVEDNYNQIPVRIMSGSLGTGLPKRDLLVSPGHAMLIDGILVLAKSLVNGITITQDWIPDEIHYYHIELEAHDCLLAEGAWSESYADITAFRTKFHNATEFYALYPDGREPAEPVLCAPRPLSGPALAAVLDPIVRRVTAAITPGNLFGYIDEITGNKVRGWAWDECNPYLPVALEIVLRGHVIGRVLACDYRPDLEAAGFGHRRCSFEFTSSLGLPSDAALQLQILRVQDGAALSMQDTCVALRA